MFWTIRGTDNNTITEHNNNNSSLNNIVKTTTLIENVFFWFESYAVCFITTSSNSVYPGTKNTTL